MFHKSPGKEINYKYCPQTKLNHPPKYTGICGCHMWSATAFPQTCRIQPGKAGIMWGIPKAAPSHPPVLPGMESSIPGGDHLKNKGNKNHTSIWYCSRDIPAGMCKRMSSHFSSFHSVPVDLYFPFGFMQLSLVCSPVTSSPLGQPG